LNTHPGRSEGRPRRRLLESGVGDPQLLINKAALNARYCPRGGVSFPIQGIQEHIFCSASGAQRANSPRRMEQTEWNQGTCADPVLELTEPLKAPCPRRLFLRWWSEKTVVPVHGCVAGAPVVWGWKLAPRSRCLRSASSRCASTSACVCCASCSALEFSPRCAYTRLNW
jgi:hypothetical protein